MRDFLFTHILKMFIAGSSWTSRNPRNCCRHFYHHEGWQKMDPVHNVRRHWARLHVGCRGGFVQERGDVDENLVADVG